MNFQEIAYMAFSKAKSRWTGADLPDEARQTLTDGTHIVEPKYDGSRYRACTDGAGNTLFLSRRVSKVTGALLDKSANVPHIIDAIEEAADGKPLIVEGEVVNDKDFLSVNGVMNSKPDRAVALQLEDEDVMLNYRIHDVLVFDGGELINLAYKLRRMRFDSVIRRTGHACLLPAEEIEDANRADRYLADPEREGLMFKDPEAAYGVSGSMLKYKRTYEEDVFIFGFELGKGKHTGRIGYLLAVTRDQKIVRIGTGLTDEQREEFMLWDPPYVVVLGHYGRQKDSVRHPVLLRTRVGDSVDIPDFVYDFVTRFKAEG